MSDALLTAILTKRQHVAVGYILRKFGASSKPRRKRVEVTFKRDDQDAIIDALRDYAGKVTDSKGRSMIARATGRIYTAQPGPHPLEILAEEA